MTRLRWIIVASVSIALLLAIAGIWYLRTRNVEGGIIVPVTTSSTKVPESATRTPERGGADVIHQTEPQGEKRQERTPDELKAMYIANDSGYLNADGSPKVSTSTVTETATGVPVISPPPASASANVPADFDGDGLTNEQEAALGTNPNNPDSDGDGLTDGQEALTYRTDPLKADSDGDGYPDGAEVKAGYNPLGPDKCARATCIP